MHVLIVKNVSGEGPGTIEDHLCRERIPYSVIDLSIGDSVPRIDIFTHLLIMGGPMAVYEMHHFPCLVSEAELIHAARVFQWHGDTFDLPEGSVRLSSSDLYANQAFRYGDRVYGLQFHIEVTPAIVRDWLLQEQGIDYAAISVDSERLFVSYRQRAMKFYGLFFEE